MPCRGLCLLAVTALFYIHASTTDVTRYPERNANLSTATTQLDRLAQLPNNADWTFDFTAQERYTFSPGSVVNANAATFPAAVDNELTMALISLGPCAMLPPHYHPRGSNYVVAVTGNTTTYMIEENGANMITENLRPGMMTIFPRGSTHSMANHDCGRSQLVSALSDPDAGTQNIVNSLFKLPSYVVNAAFGNPLEGVNIDSSKIPPVGSGAMEGDSECRARCGLS